HHIDIGTLQVPCNLFRIRLQNFGGPIQQIMSPEYVAVERMIDSQGVISIFVQGPNANKFAALFFERFTNKVSQTGPVLDIARIVCRNLCDPRTRLTNELCCLLPIASASPDSLNRKSSVKIRNTSESLGR